MSLSGQRDLPRPTPKVCGPECISGQGPIKERHSPEEQGRQVCEGGQGEEGREEERKGETDTERRARKPAAAGLCQWGVESYALIS